MARVPTLALLALLAVAGAARAARADVPPAKDDAPAPTVVAVGEPVKVAEANANSAIVITSNSSIEVQKVPVAVVAVAPPPPPQDNENAAIARILKKHVELAVYTPPLNSTQLAALADFHERFPPNRTNYWAREMLVTNYLSQLPEDVKAQLPVPPGFRGLHPTSRAKVAAIFYAPPSANIPYWEKVLTVAQYLQTLVPDEVVFHVNVTVRLSGRYTRAQLKPLMTRDEWAHVEKLQRNRQMGDEARGFAVGAILRHVYARDPSRRDWPVMPMHQDLPPTVQDAVRHLWFDERAYTDHRPLLDVYQAHIAPHIVPREYVGNRGVTKVCAFLPKEEAKQRLAETLIDELWQKKRNDFTFGDMHDHLHTAGPSAEDDDAAQPTVTIRHGDGIDTTVASALDGTTATAMPEE